VSHPAEDRVALGGEADPLHLIDLSPLLAELAGASSLVPHLSVTSESGGERLTADADLRADRTNRGVRIVGSINGLQEGVCARCLAPAKTLLQVKLDEEILEERHATGEAERIGRGNSVDVGRLAIESLDLVRSLVLHCDPPCPERCGRCGGGHQVAACPEQQIDPRLAVLGRLLPTPDEEPERRD